MKKVVSAIREGNSSLTEDTKLILKEGCPDLRTYNTMTCSRSPSGERLVPLIHLLKGKRGIKCPENVIWGC